MRRTPDAFRVAIMWSATVVIYLSPRGLTAAKVAAVVVPKTRWALRSLASVCRSYSQMFL
jgi:hypothetical protein